MTHKTKGIVLRTVTYGETSIISSVYTELFGIQSYIVKGVRKSSRTSQGKASYFQPAAMLDMIVYHNDLKNLQFIKEYNWSYLYSHLFFDVVKNAVAMYIIELLHNSLKQPEANPALFYLVENTLQQLDKANPVFTANLPLYFTLQLGSELGFQIQGAFNKQTPVLDLQEGQFVEDIPLHPYYITGDAANTSALINNSQSYSDLETITLNRRTRRELLQAYQQYIALHIADFTEMRSLVVLQEVLS